MLLIRQSPFFPFLPLLVVMLVVNNNVMYVTFGSRRKKKTKHWLFVFSMNSPHFWIVAVNTEDDEDLPMVCCVVV